MRGFYQSYKPQLILALIFALLLTQVNIISIQAGDPDGIVGGTDYVYWVCADPSHIPVANLEGDGIQDDGTIDPDAEIDFEELKEQCEDLNENDNVTVIGPDGDEIDGPFRVEPLQLTRIEGYIYEFHPRDPENPAKSEWFAVPSIHVPVIAEGVGFEILWDSDDNGFFYFRYLGAGPILLNMPLPNDAHALNPNILIESTGLDDTWTVFLGFYRGDVGPAHPELLRTPNGNPLPFGTSKYESTGLDGRGILPGVGGVLPQKVPTPVIILAGLLVLLLPAVGALALRKRHSKNSPG